MAFVDDRDLLDYRLDVGYWAESSGPIASLVFVAPLLLVYEIGMLTLGPEAVRNGADVWLRQLLSGMGLGQYFLLPVLTVAILLGWQHATRRPWHLSGGILSGMLLECVLLALCLRLLLQLQGSVFDAVTGATAAIKGQPSGGAGTPVTTRIVVGYLGAGVYEELLFRLISLPLAVWAFRVLGAPRRPSVVFAVVLLSAVFAAAHYVGEYGDAFQLSDPSFWFGFSFRFLAGVFFSVLFVHRGFGVAAGTHAGYDILVGLF
ncbi:MAG: CPBP family intramembrane glutamic endopeptidase [Planctomycetota bacterium]|jgi:hypothetical protein